MQYFRKYYSISLVSAMRYETIHLWTTFEKNYSCEHFYSVYIKTKRSTLSILMIITRLLGRCIVGILFSANPVNNMCWRNATKYHCSQLLVSYIER